MRQRVVSHHYRIGDGRAGTFRSPHRYVWPSELDLMGRIAGLELTERWDGWDGWDGWDEAPFTDDSTSHVSVRRKPPTDAT